MRNFLNDIENKILIHDGSKGYMLQKLGLKGGECGELWNITNADAVRSIYRSYVDAGSDVIQTNTFTGSRVHLHKYSLDEKVYEINYQGAALARDVAGEDIYVCASIGPTGMLFEPSGELTFDMAYDVYKEQVKAVADGGADIINFETFTDLAEMRAALLAAKETVNLPVICSIAFESNGRTLMGSDPVVVAMVLKSLGADMVGSNCSFGAEHMLGIAKTMYEAGAGFISMKPNAGLPEVADGCVRYKETPENFALMSKRFIDYGARLIGGCCGTTPEFIKALKECLKGCIPAPAKQVKDDIITSNTKYIDLGKLNWKNVGTIDADKDGELAGALERDDLSYIEDVALDIASEDYDAVYVNIGGRNSDPQMLSKVVDKIQWYVREPLIINASSEQSLEAALRSYRGIAGVVISRNSEDANKILSVASRYGSVIVDNDKMII